MKKVLIAIDYNPCAQKVAETGYEYAKAMRAEICIAHVIADIAYYSMEYLPIMGFEGFDPDCSYKNLVEQEAEATRFLDAVIRHLGDASIMTKVLDGETATSILQYAKIYQANLLVMGAQSHNGLEKIIMGDVIGNVLKHAEIPILVVPTHKKGLTWASEKQEEHQYRSKFTGSNVFTS
jgi:nucleotide-binding universal stress UspA family protein